MCIYMYVYNKRSFENNNDSQVQNSESLFHKKSRKIAKQSATKSCYRGNRYLCSVIC